MDRHTWRMRPSGRETHEHKRGKAWAQRGGKRARLYPGAWGGVQLTLRTPPPDHPCYWPSIDTPLPAPGGAAEKQGSQ